MMNEERCTACGRVIVIPPDQVQTTEASAVGRLREMFGITNPQQEGAGVVVVCGECYWLILVRLWGDRGNEDRGRA